MKTKAARNMTLMSAASILTIVVTFLLSVYLVDLMMPIVVVGVSVTIFLAHNLAAFWREYDRVRLLLRACDNELRKDLKLLKTEKGLPDFDERFVPTMWNVDTYKGMARLLLMEQSQVYLRDDLEKLITLMEQDDVFQIKFWSVFGEEDAGPALRAIAYKRAHFQRKIRQQLEITLHYSSVTS